MKPEKLKEIDDLLYKIEILLNKINHQSKSKFNRGYIRALNDAKEILKGKNHSDV